MFSNGNYSEGNSPVLLAGVAAVGFVLMPASGAMRRYRQIKE